MRNIIIWNFKLEFELANQIKKYCMIEWQRFSLNTIYGPNILYSFDLYLQLGFMTTKLLANDT